jgi:uncharacterized protein (TIGR02145 family)
MVTGSTTQQTDNGIVEKYCYANNAANCTTYGGLYQWAEAVQHTATPDSPPIQGICPAGSHIPTDNEWKTLEMALGMTQVQADATGWRGTDQGTQMKIGGSSGLELTFGGYSDNTNSWYLQGTYGYYWSSTQSGASAIWRSFATSNATVARSSNLSKLHSFSVRCLKD